MEYRKFLILNEDERKTVKVNIVFRNVVCGDESFINICIYSITFLICQPFSKKSLLLY